MESGSLIGCSTSALDSHESHLHAHRELMKYIESEKVKSMNGYNNACDKPNDITTCRQHPGIANKQIVSYHRTTSRIGDFALTCLEDGTLHVKNGKDNLSFTYEQMMALLNVAFNVRDHKREYGLTLLRDLDFRIKESKEQTDNSIEYFKTQREEISKEYGI